MNLAFRIICTLWALHFYTFSNPHDYGVLQKCSLTNGLEISTFYKQDNIGIVEFSNKNLTPKRSQDFLTCLQSELPSDQDFIYKDAKLLLELNTNIEESKHNVRTTRSRIVASKLEVTGTCSINGAEIKIKTSEAIYQTTCIKNKWYYLSENLSKEPQYLIVTQISTKGKKSIDLKRL